MLGPHILAALDGTDITPAVETLILKHRVLGFTLFRRNIESGRQLRALTHELQLIAKKAGYTLVIAVDQEGGRVARLVEPEFAKIPPMLKWSELFANNNQAENLFELGVILAEQLLSCGFNLDFAPVVDVNTRAENPVIGDRSFGADPEMVYLCARNIMRGLRKAGVLNCIKHFPGHGATIKDSHFDLPVDTRSEAEILRVDITPFQKLIAESLPDSLMTAHVVYPNIDAKNPATVSPKIITEILRQKLNYQGVVFSDDMMMKAISDHYGIENALRDFLLAGGDAALICEHPELSLELISKLETDAGTQQAQTLQNQLKQAKVRLSALTQKLPQPIKITADNAIETLYATHHKKLSNIFA